MEKEQMKSYPLIGKQKEDIDAVIQGVVRGLSKVKKREVLDIIRQRFPPNEIGCIKGLDDYVNMRFYTEFMFELESAEEDIERLTRRQRELVKSLANKHIRIVMAGHIPKWQCFNSVIEELGPGIDVSDEIKREEIEQIIQRELDNVLYK